MQSNAHSIIVVGASGHLSRNKIIPALFSLYCQGFLPDDFRLYGFARSEFSHEAFREKITMHLTCRYTPGENECADKMTEFLSRCFYVQGGYGDYDSYLDLYQLMKEHEGSEPANRMFYLAVPPAVFSDVAKAIGDTGLVNCTTDEPWTRVIVEKPFGKDRASSDELTKKLSGIFVESQIYRIDHYLGKEVIQNLLVLRFANLVFEPIWNSRYIERVEIDWKEDMGVEGRGGYFDDYGIIRDVMQNHLLQIMALVAIEPPTKLDARHIMAEKVRVLKSAKPLLRDDVLIGQYKGYRDDETVPDESLTETYASAVIRIDNERWRGVPFVITAGKGLECKMTEIRIKFKQAAVDCMHSESAPEPNELVIRVQPDESINLSVLTKVPGMGLKVEPKNLDLRYGAVFDDIIPDAYESLLHDVIEGDKSLFIGSSELEAAWDIFTPVLKELEGEVPEPYEFKGKGRGTVEI
ncbi:glucose-6-phosphate dehydrogenase [bacterium E08(2017)]|nr:glucose-6-phosphate dehydrogenase [bacterium E08(2017)]